jgi:membrane protein
MPETPKASKKTPDASSGRKGAFEKDRLPARSSFGLSLRAWWVVLRETYHAIGIDRLSLLAAGVAFYMLFAVFPGLTALISLYGLLADPASVKDQLEGMHGILPEQAWSLISKQLVSITSGSGKGLSLTGIISLLFALYSTRLAATAVMDALNAIYDVRETRSFIQVNLLALLFTIGAIIGLIFFIAAIVFAPIALDFIGLGPMADLLIRYLRWPAVALAMVAGLTISYRYGPARPLPTRHWLTWGAVLATILWLIASIGFSWYVAEFGSYDKVYGSLGAVIILLFWFWLTAFVVLLGAELDVQIAHQMLHGGAHGPKHQPPAYLAGTGKQT